MQLFPPPLLTSRKASLVLCFHGEFYQSVYSFVLKQLSWLFVLDNCTKILQKMSIFIHQSSPIKRPTGRNADFKKVLRSIIKTTWISIIYVIFKILKKLIRVKYLVLYKWRILTEKRQKIDPKDIRSIWELKHVLIYANHVIVIFDLPYFLI